MTDKKGAVRLTAMCTIVYLVTYLSRINLGAIMVELIQTGFAPRETVALALTLSSITYGSGQVLSGWIGDRCKPQNVIWTGFLMTGIINLSVAVCRNPALLIPLWAINGIAQSLMWPPLVRIMAHYLDSSAYDTASIWVSWGSSFGTILVYAGAPLLISLGSFRWVFLASGTTALVTGFLWKVLYTRHFRDLPATSKKSAPSDTDLSIEPFNRQTIVIILALMAAIMVHGMLRDGVTNWMPTFVSEQFGLNSSSAILAGVILPVFQIICVRITSWVHRKLFPNELTCAGFFFALGCIASVMLAYFAKHSAVISAICIGLLVGCMSSINFLLICLVPAIFRRFGRVSLISGVLNCSTYVGSALSTYGFAIFSGSFGWDSTILLWAIIAAAGLAVCLGLARKWAQFKK